MSDGETSIDLKFKQIRSNLYPTTKKKMLPLDHGGDNQKNDGIHMSKAAAAQNREEYTTTTAAAAVYDNISMATHSDNIYVGLDNATAHTTFCEFFVIHSSSSSSSSSSPRRNYHSKVSRVLRTVQKVLCY
jgi:hypothetical protein